MTHIDRLLKTSPNHRTRELLDAGLKDSPPRGALTRVAAGLGVVVGGSTWSAVAAGAGSAASAAGAGAASAGTLTLLGVGKLLAIGAVAGTLVSGASVAIERVRSPAASASASGARAVTPAAPDVPRVSETSVRAEPSPAFVETPRTPSNAVVADDASRAAPRTASSDSGALAAEVARIDAARSALASGNAERALSELAAYQRERRLGVLDREAALLAIRAHSERGETARAEELARRYLSAHPNDAHGPSLRELLEKK